MAKKFPQKNFISTELSHKNVFLNQHTLVVDKDFFAIFMDGRSNYYFEVNSGELLTNVPDTCWVTLNVNSYTGELELSATTNNPVRYLEDFPSNPDEGDLFIHVINKRGYKFYKNNWIKFIYLPFCRVENNKILNIFTEYSHGTNHLEATILAGKILFDKNLEPLYVREGGETRFLTDVEEWAISLKDVKNLTTGNTFTTNIASAFIPKYSLLKREPDYNVSICSSMARTPAVAISLRESNTGEFCPILEKGFIKDPSWRWDVEPNTNLYCSKNGTLTLVPDFSSSSFQIVGYVVDVDTIFFDPQDRIYINSLAELNS